MGRGICTRLGRAIAFALALLGFLLPPRPLGAVQVLTIDTTQVSFSTPSASAYNAGHMEKLSTNTLTVESDIDWKVTVLGTSATWSCTGAGCWGAKPRSDVDWRVSGGTYTALLGTAVTVATGLPTTPGTEDVVMDYRVRLDWTTDAPGTYQYDFVRYQVSAL